MLAVVIGDFSIILGLAILLLPLLITELSRPKDSFWGALTMILGLVLITSKERLSGSPMLAVLFSSLIIFRLLLEVSQNRWQQLTLEEKAGIKSFSLWNNRISQIIAVFGRLGSIVLAISDLFKGKPKPSSIGKKWVRPETNNKSAGSDSKQLASLEGNIDDKNFASDQISTLASGNTPSDAS